MRLVSFSVNNFRSVTGGLEQNRVNLESSNAVFIFGQNNVGKSSILRAYKAFYEGVVSKDDFSYAGGDIEVEIWLRIEDKDKDLIEESAPGKYANLHANYLDDQRILKIRKTWKSSDGGQKPLDQTYSTAAKKWDDKAYAGIGLDTVFRSSLMTPLFIKAMPSEDDVTLVVTEVIKEIAQRKFKLESKKLDEAIKKVHELQDEIYSKDVIDSYKKDVNERFSELFRGYEIDIDEGVSRAKFTHDKIGKDFGVSFKDDDDQKTNHEQMGHGAVRMAIFLLMLLRDKLHGEEGISKNFLVLFEEPELFLHPSLTKKLRDLIYDVSNEEMPFQVLCASHSPQMIDLSKDHTSLVRMVKLSNSATALYQVAPEDLKNSAQPTEEDVRQKIYEVLRFDPFVCESFYADEVVLVEGDTEAIIWRGYQQLLGFKRELFVVNCHSINNIPFYQRVFSKFNIPYSVLCDTDHKEVKDPDSVNKNGWNMSVNEPKFNSHIQKTIADQFYSDKKVSKCRYFFVFPISFEPAHQSLLPPFNFHEADPSKPLMADKYWRQISAHTENKNFTKVPVIYYIKKISE